MSRMGGERQDSENLTQPNFHKIIMPRVINDGRLALPRNFVARYGDELSTTARLDLPIGRSWYIGLNKSGLLLFLDDGWEKLMKRYSIRVGYFLFFKFKGNSRFDLHIFDLTTVEIQYPLVSHFKRSNHSNENAAREKQFLDVPEVKEEEEDESISDNLETRSKIRSSKQNAFAAVPIQQRRADGVILTRNEHHNPTTKQLPLASSHGLYQQSTSKNAARGKQFLDAAEVKEEEDNESISDDLVALGSSHGLNQQSTSKKIKCQLGKNPALEQEGEAALRAATMYKTENPFFIAKMKKYNVTGSYTLNLPSHFRREIVTNEAEFIEIQDSEGNKWRRRCNTRDGKVVGITKGWSKFAKEKGLQIGDVCVFELIHSATIKISLFYAKDWK